MFITTAIKKNNFKIIINIFIYIIGNINIKMIHIIIKDDMEFLMIVY